MKYTGKETSKKELLKNHSELVKSNNYCFGTSDGNCFVGDRSKNLAYSHAALYKPSLNVFDLKAKDMTQDDSDDVIEETQETPSIEPLIKNKNKLTKK